MDCSVLRDFLKRRLQPVALIQFNNEGLKLLRG